MVKVKKTVNSSIRKSSYRFDLVTTKSGIPCHAQDYYEDIDVLNYELSKCNSIEEVRECLDRNSKYGFEKHTFVQELDGELLFHRGEHSGYYDKVWIKGASSGSATGQYRLEGTYTSSGIRYCAEDVFGTDPDIINMKIANCSSLEEVRDVIESNAPYLHDVYLLTELDGIATFVGLDLYDNKMKIKVKTE